MPLEESDDEFGCDFDGIDFSAIPGLNGLVAQPTNPPVIVSDRPPNRDRRSSSRSSSSYGLDDELDSDLLAAADALEARALTTTSKLDCQSSDLPHDTHKRPCTTPLTSPSAAKKGKRREDGDNCVQVILENFENELTCPICCDIFVAAHISNPCGHTCCGQCAYEWVSQTKYSPTCTVCRTKLVKSLPLIPNFSVDNLVQQYLRAWAKSGQSDWQANGVKMNDWNERLKIWKAISAKRAAEAARIAKRKQDRQERQRAVPIIDLVDDYPYDDFVNFSDADPTYEDDEVGGNDQRLGAFQPRRTTRARTVRVFVGP